MPPARQRLTSHEQVPGPVALVLVIKPFPPSCLGRDGRPLLGHQLPGGLVETDYGPLGVIGFRVEVQHVLHAGYELGAHLWDAPLLFPPGLEFVFFSTCLTVSREMESVNSSSTAWSASNRNVQRACPSGGALQATATKWASCFPSSLRRCPGRGRSSRARFNPPSTKRCRPGPPWRGPPAELPPPAGR